MYWAVQDSMVSLYGSLSAEEATTRVPTCPEWTVKDVLAHVVGIGDDFKTHTRDGAGGDAWTAAQVATRADRDVGEILAEWAGLASFLDDLFSANPDLAAALVADLVTHMHGVLTALGRKADRSGAAVTASAERYADRFVDRVGGSDLEAAAVAIDGVRRGPAGAEVVVSGSAFELLRAFTGRRSLDQIRAMDWTGDPGPYVDIISAYGQASSVDVSE